MYKTNYWFYSCPCLEIGKHRSYPVDQCMQSPSTVPEDQLPVQQGQAKTSSLAHV